MSACECFYGSSATLSYSLYVRSMFWKKRRLRCNSNNSNNKKTGCISLQMSWTKNANRIIACTLGNPPKNCRCLRHHLLCCISLFSHTHTQARALCSHSFSAISMVFSICSAGLTCQPLYFFGEAEGSEWCVYGRFCYKCIVILNMLNKRRRDIYLLFPQFILCCGMRASNSISA